MEQITISDNGPEVSQLIYSFWRASEDPINFTKEEIEKRLHLCLELGINTFDHADVYGNYSVESLFGEALKASGVKREDVVISTKSGINIVGDARPDYRIKHYDNSPEHLIKSVDQSLKNLQTDYIDIFLLHHYDILAEPDETASVLTDLVKKGKVRYIGVANFTINQHKLLASRLSIPIVTNHLELNVLHTKPLEDGTIDFIRQQYSKPMAWAPLAGGMLNVYNDERTYSVTNTLRRIASRYEVGIEHIAIAWLIQIGAVPILGTNSYNRIRNAAAAVQLKLDRQDWYEIYFAATRSSLHNFS